MFNNLTMEEMKAMLEQMAREKEEAERRAEEVERQLAERDAKEFEGKSLLFKQRVTVLNMTREQLAEATGISVNTLSNYEIMKNAPSYLALPQVKEAYQLTDEQFMDFINELIEDAPRKAEENAKKKAKEKAKKEEEVVVEEIKPKSRKVKKVS